MKEKPADVQAERDRYKAALEDFRDFSPYIGARERAVDALRLSQPFVRSVPQRHTGRAWHLVA